MIENFCPAWDLGDCFSSVKWSRGLTHPLGGRSRERLSLRAVTAVQAQRLGEKAGDSDGKALQIAQALAASEDAK